MNLVIHCGLHKTATTSFQHFCRSNQSELASLGVCFPNYKGYNQHGLLMHEFQRLGIGVVEEYFGQFFEQASPTSNTVLLSGESFENCIVDLSVAQELEEAAKKSGFSSGTWVVVTRT